MCLDTRQSCLTLGTSSGYHTCWDLRFRLPIATIAHSKGNNFNFKELIIFKIILLINYISCTSQKINKTSK